MTTRQQQTSVDEEPVPDDLLKAWTIQIARGDPHLSPAPATERQLQVAAGLRTDIAAIKEQNGIVEIPFEIV